VILLLPDLVLLDIPATAAAAAVPVPLFSDIEHIFCIDDTIVLLPLAAVLLSAAIVVVFPVVVAFLLVVVAWEDDDVWADVNMAPENPANVNSTATIAKAKVALLAANLFL
jgi:hypothetical protein